MAAAAPPAWAADRNGDLEGRSHIRTHGSGVATWAGDSLLDAGVAMSRIRVAAQPCGLTVLVSARQTTIGCAVQVPTGNHDIPLIHAGLSPPHTVCHRIGAEIGPRTRALR